MSKILIVSHHLAILLLLIIFYFVNKKIRLLHNDYNIMNFRVLFFTDGEDTKSSKEEKERIKELFYNHKDVNLFFHAITFYK